MRDQEFRGGPISAPRCKTTLLGKPEPSSITQHIEIFNFGLRKGIQAFFESALVERTKRFRPWLVLPGSSRRRNQKVLSCSKGAGLSTNQPIMPIARLVELDPTLPLARQNTWVSSGLSMLGACDGYDEYAVIQLIAAESPERPSLWYACVLFGCL